MKRRGAWLPPAHEHAFRALAHDFYGPGGEVERFAGELLAAWLLSRRRYREEVVDSGYDVSIHARATDQGHRLSDYATVQDFLNEPSGETVATFISGSGLTAQRLEEVFADALAEAEAAFVRARVQPGDDDEDFALIEALSDDDELNPVRYTWLEGFLRRPLADVVAPYWEGMQEQLIEQAARREAEARYQRARKEQFERLGERAEARLEAAGVRLKGRYEMPQQGEVEALMQRLEQLGAGPEERHAFVATRLKGRLSNRLLALLTRAFPDAKN